MKQLRNSKRRDAILDVAAEAFLKKGYAGVTMSWIAEKSGGSKATLWRHFSSKELLFEAVLERETVSVRNNISLSLQAEDDFEVGLRKFCLAFLEMVNHPDIIALNRLVMGEVSRFPEIGRIFLARGPHLINEQLSEYINKAMQNNLLIKKDAKVAARYISSMCLSGMHQDLLFDLVSRIPKKILKQEADSVVDTFMKAYKA